MSSQFWIHPDCCSVELHRLLELSFVLHGQGCVVIAHELLLLLRLLGGQIVGRDGVGVSIVHNFAAQNIFLLTGLAIHLCERARR